MLSRIRRGLRLTRLLIPVLVLLVVALAVVIAVAVAQTTPEVAGVSVTLVPATGDMEVGSTGDFDVLVSPNGIGNIAAAQFGIRFDPNVLEVLSVTHDNSVLQVPLGSPTIDNAAGTAFFGALTFAPLAANQQPFNLAAIRFRVKAPATGDQTDVGFEVDLDRKTAVVNGNGELLLDDTVDYLAATITIIGVPPLDAVIIAPDTGDEGRPVPFDASQSDGDIVTYDWDFGDGQTANFAIGDHVYGDDGAYTVTLVITDSSGATGATHQITINNVAPVITELTADPQVFAEGGNSIIAVSADDVAADLPLGYLFDCNNDGFFEVEQTGDSSTVCSFPDGSIHTVLVQVQDKDGGVTSGDVTVTVANVAPAVSAVGAQTVNEGTPLDLDPIATFTDPGILDTHTATISWGDGTVDVGAVSEAGGSGTVAGSHTYAASGDYTVIVSVTDDDAGTGQDTLTVSVVSEVAEDQWDASLVITANSPDVSLNSGIGTLTFGIHPDAQDTGDPELDEEVPPNPPQPYATFYFDYPDNGPGFRKLFTSRISPPVTVRDIQKWPLRIEVLLVSPVTSPDGVDVNVNIDWNLDGVPSSFITAILFDGGSEPANQVSSMGGPGPYTLTIHIPQGGIIAFRDLTVAVSRSHVQAMVLYDQWNMAALTVEPDSRNKDAILTDVVGASVITWDPLARTYVVANELLPGNGYWIKAIGDSIQLIPGDPIEENVRGAAP